MKVNEELIEPKLETLANANKSGAKLSLKSLIRDSEAVIIGPKFEKLASIAEEEGDKVVISTAGLHDKEAIRRASLANQSQSPTKRKSQKKSLDPKIIEKASQSPTKRKSKKKDEQEKDTKAAPEEVS